MTLMYVCSVIFLVMMIVSLVAACMKKTDIVFGAVVILVIAMGVFSFHTMGVRGEIRNLRCSDMGGVIIGTKCIVGEIKLKDVVK